MDRELLQKLLTTVYVSENQRLSIDELKAAIGQIKEIEENKLNKITRLYG